MTQAPEITNQLILDNNWRIVTDENNVTLQFFEQRERKKQDETVEPFEYVDSYYYPTMKVALLMYLQKSIKPSKSIQEIVKRIEKAEHVIVTLFGKGGGNA
jgi:hypothetical protein